MVDCLLRKEPEDDAGPSQRPGVQGHELPAPIYLLN
jgi:hypothetical protein